MPEQLRGESADTVAAQVLHLGTAISAGRYAGHCVDDLAWYEAFAALRLAIISIRTTMRSVRFGPQAGPEHPDDFVMFNPLLRQLLEAV